MPLRGLLVFQFALSAMMAWAHGDSKETLEILDDRIEAEPNSVALLLERSEIQRRRGNFDAAIHDLLHARTIAPADHRVDYFLGLNCLDKGDLADAEAALRRYVETVPDSPAGRIALAKTLSAQHRHLDAAEQYDWAIAAQPTPVPDHYLARARAYSAAGEGYHHRAIEGLDEAMRQLGPLSALQNLAIEIELARGTPAGAINRIDDLLAEAQRKETWLVRKARILAAIGHEREALDTFREARAAVHSLPQRLRSTPAMIALRKTVSEHLDKDTHDATDHR